MPGPVGPACRADWKQGVYGIMERETLKSRLGFILLSAGCAIGIGNVWKFPYIAGQGGGGAFVLFYLVFLVILGLPIMTMEFAVGRASRKSPVRAYQALEKPGQKWHIHGYLTLIGCYLLMMFYTTVAGWMLHYFYMTAIGQLSDLNAEQVHSFRNWPTEGRGIGRPFPVFPEHSALSVLILIH